MAHNLFVYENKAYDGELALARCTKSANTQAAAMVRSYDTEPRLVFRVAYDGKVTFVTDQVAVCRLRAHHPDCSVDIIPVVA